MQPVQITYHGLAPSDALTALIHARAAQLERVSERIHSLRVLVDAPHHHHRQGNHYRVRIEVGVPGGEVVVGHDVDERDADEDAYRAVRRAFDAIRRRLTTTQARTRGRQRAHADERFSIRAAR
ncbi:MAG TPA: HPF/RaiA family ribosome-associated protein [Polyangia bacterium]|nr:HPF/RaiA family ribosome-associated protein [Polyangia bacterium]